MESSNNNRRNFLKGACLGAAGTALHAMAAPSVWAKGKTIHWRMVTSWPKNLPILQLGAEWFAKRVEFLSQGRLKIDVHAGGELVGALDVFDAVSEGTAEVGNGCAYYWGKKIPAASWFTTVPFGLKAQDLSTWISQGGGSQLYEETYAPYGVIPMLGGNTGIQMGGWFNREIKNGSDFKGLKMRIPGLGGKVIEKLGAQVVLLPVGDIFKSMQNGTINATEWIGPYHDIRMGFDKVAKYYYAPGWHEPGTANEITINRQAFESLTDDLQGIVRAAVAELNNQVITEFEYYNSRAMLKIVKDRKVILRQFPYSVLRELQRLSAEVLDDEANKDPQAKRVHEAFSKFKNEMTQFSLLRGDEFRF
jgi:TRAP-type mannitol/chloroaromatic compound transport system substrate-binding protein